MSVSDIICLSFKNVARGKIRVTLSVLAVAVGVSAVIILLSLGDTASAFISDKLGSFGLDGIMVYADERVSLDQTDTMNIKENISEIKSAMPFEFLFAYFKLNSNTKEPCVIIGADESISDYMEIDLLVGREINNADCAYGNKVCIIDKRLGGTGRVGNKIKLEINGDQVEFTVVGICSSTMDMASSLLGVDIPPFIYVPWTSVCGDGGSFSQLALKLEDGADSATAAKKVKAYLTDCKVNGKYLDVEDMTVFKQEFNNIIDLVALILAGTAAISFIVATLGIMSSMISSVNERKCEIGVCKSIGARSSEICALYLFESVIISVLGAFIGAVSGGCLLYTAFYLCFETFPKIELSTVILPCVCAVAVGLISGVVPAVNASKLSPVNAMRRE